MKNRISSVQFFKPQVGDLWFRQAMLADPGTMDSSRARSGASSFPREEWEEWYGAWVSNPRGRFYRYVTTGTSRSFVGEASWHFDPEREVYLADVAVSARCLGQGYGEAALELLCAAARNEGIPELHGFFAMDHPGISLFLRCGFAEANRTGQDILLKKEL